MFCLPDIQRIQRRRKFLGGPLSHRQYNNNLFVKLSTPAPQPQPLADKLSTARKSFTRKSSLNHTSAAIRRSSRERMEVLQSQTSRVMGSKLDKVLPYVTVFLVDLITSYEHIQQKIVVLDLEKYFEAFFKKVLKGEFTGQFYREVDKYLRMIDEHPGSANKTVHSSSLPIELLQLSTKQEFLNMLLQLEKKNEIELVMDAIRYYCLPSQQFREEIVKDIKLILKQELRESFDYLEAQLHGEFSLIDMKKKHIGDMLQIPFGTVSLMFCSKDTLESSYKRFYSLSRNQTMEQKKVSFVESLKLSFRESHPNTDRQAQSSRQMKSNEKVVEKTAKKQFVRILKRHPSITADDSSTLNHEKQQLYISLKHIPYDLFCHLYEQFRQMHLKNDAYIKDFNILPEHRLLLLKETFLRECPYIRGRRQQVKDRILRCLRYDQHKKHITARQYIEFRTLVDCAVDRSTLLKFLLGYLRLDEAPLNKQQLCEVLGLTLEQEDPNSARVITDVIWFWLKRNKYIDMSDNRELLKAQAFIQRFYRNEMIYYFLMSIIFGTSEVSAVDLAYSIVL